MARTAGVFALGLTIGCGPGLAGDGDGSESATGSDTVVGDGDGDGDAGDGDGDGGDGDGETGDGDGDAGDGDGDGDGDFEPGCEPQMATSTEDSCAEPQFAWSGNGCAEICACDGPDCGELYGSVGACLSAYEPTCGLIGLDTCPFEIQPGPTAITGTTSYGANEYTVGAFGMIYGESTPNFSIALATDLVTLGNHLWNTWDPLPTTDVLMLWGGNTMLGEHQIYVQTALPLSRGVMGTFTVTSVVPNGDFLDQELWATLDVSEGEWELHGQLAIPGCQRLEQHLP